MSLRTATMKTFLLFLLLAITPAIAAPPNGITVTGLVHTAGFAPRTSQLKFTPLIGTPFLNTNGAWHDSTPLIVQVRNGILARQQLVTGWYRVENEFGRDARFLYATNDGRTYN